VILANAERKKENLKLSSDDSPESLESDEDSAESVLAKLTQKVKEVKEYLAPNEVIKD